MRKLASVQYVWNVEPIEDADRIELASVLGWQCVVNKGDFHKGDLGVYFEIDSFLPIRPEFEFLRSSSYKKTDIMGEGFLLRTKKFKGQISQGLLLPLETFGLSPAEYHIGDDVTDLVRVQAEPGLIQQFANIPYYISTKMDGSSHSVSLDENGFHVCGHNYEYKDDGSSSFYRFVNDAGIRSAVEKYASDHGLKTLTLQGEFCAPGIQQNRLRLKKPAWYVFTIRVNGNRVGLTEMSDICAQLGIEMVPIEEIGEDLPSKYPTVESLLERSDGNYPNGGKKEGIVIRPVMPVYSALIGTYLSMKVVNNNYLLKQKG